MIDKHHSQLVQQAIYNSGGSLRVLLPDSEQNLFSLENADGNSVFERK